MDSRPPSPSALCLSYVSCLRLSGSLKLLLLLCTRTLTSDNAKSYTPREEPNTSLDHREKKMYILISDRDPDR